MPERTFAPHDEPPPTGRLIDRIAPRPTPPPPREVLAEAWRAVPPDERLRFLADTLTEEERQAFARPATS